MMGHNTLKTARLIAQKRRTAKVRKGKMDLFTFTYENKIDRKGRVSVPAQYRSIFVRHNESPVFAQSLTGRYLEGMRPERLEQMSEAMDRMDTLSDEFATLTMMISNTTALQPDGEGRIILPEQFLSYANLTDAVLFAGIGRSFQMWNPQDYAKHKQKHLNKIEKGEIPPLLLNPSKPAGGTR